MRARATHRCRHGRSFRRHKQRTVARYLSGAYAPLLRFDRFNRGRMPSTLRGDSHPDPPNVRVHSSERVVVCKPALTQALVVTRLETFTKAVVEPFRHEPGDFHLSRSYRPVSLCGAYQAPVLPIDSHGSCGGRFSPFCRISIDMPSGERTKAMCPSRGGRLMVTPLSIRCWQVA